MDNAMERASQTVVIERKHLSQLWFNSSGRKATQAGISPVAVYVELPDIAPEARDVLRQTFLLYSYEGKSFFPCNC